MAPNKNLYETEPNRYAMLRKRTTLITPEEKERWKPILQRSWDYVAWDAIVACGGECSRSEVIEFACDADRPCQDHGYGDRVMTREEYKVLCQWYGTSSFKKWMREEVFPNKCYVI